MSQATVSTPTLSPRLLFLTRAALVVLALALAFVAARKGLQAARYFSPLTELSGTVTSAELTGAIPLAKGNPRAREVTQPVPTRVTLELREQPGLRFQVALREDPDLIPPRIAPGEAVTLLLPGRWRELEVGDRVLAMGLKRAGAVLVDPAGYPWAAEYRTAFLAVGAAVGAAIAALGAWRIGRR